MSHRSGFFYVVFFTFFYSCGQPPNQLLDSSSSLQFQNSNLTTPQSEIDAYYSKISNEQGQNLRLALYQVISKGRSISYDQAEKAFFSTDASIANSARMRLFYSGTEVNSKQSSLWNREHVWPASRGIKGKSSAAYSDLHHLRPALKSVNSIRGNKDFGYGGTPVPAAPGNLVSNKTFEPDDRFKGDVSRILFYMATRYMKGSGANLDLITPTTGSGSNMGNLCVLLEWNSKDPVDSSERLRNDEVYGVYQKNRNPFIDHPEYAEKIWATQCPN